MNVTPGARRASRRQAFAWLSFLVFIVATMMAGAVFLFRDVPLRLGLDIDRPLDGPETIAAVLIAMVMMFLLVYLGAILWLLFARWVFTKAEVEQVVYYGPTTPVERWLVDVIMPSDGQ